MTSSPEPEDGFEIILRECFLGDPLPKVLKRFRCVEQHGRQGYK